MPYALPAHYSNTTRTAEYSQVQTQDGRTERAEQTARNQYQGGTVLDVQRDGDGRPTKVHVRDQNGCDHTVELDDDQNVSRTSDGYN